MTSHHPKSFNNRCRSTKGQGILFDSTKSLFLPPSLYLINRRNLASVQYARPSTSLHCLRSEDTNRVFSRESFELDCSSTRLTCYQGYGIYRTYVSLWKLIVILAALQRVPEIKPSDVEEVFFGNVISAGYATCLTVLRIRSLSHQHRSESSTPMCTRCRPW